MTLEFITAPELEPFQHGFFTRKGGASSGIFAGLNCGQGSSDQAEIVAINRARAAEAMDLSTGDLAMVHQIHSADVLHVTAPTEPPRPRADGMVTATAGVGLAILTADCQPVLFADRQAEIIGAAHAGWKGTLSGVLEATVDAMEKLGANRGNIVAIIGPSISQPAYEVGDEFHARFADQDREALPFFAKGAPDHYQFDLTGYGLLRLKRAGL
ncbi:MAG: peptidoglycan editing factor PgeF, partial [Deltaproteobacteria bacterium]